MAVLWHTFIWNLAWFLTLISSSAVSSLLRDHMLCSCKVTGNITVLYRVYCGGSANFRIIVWKSFETKMHNEFELLWFFDPFPPHVAQLSFISSYSYIQHHLQDLHKTCFFRFFYQTYYTVSGTSTRNVQIQVISLRISTEINYKIIISRHCVEILSVENVIHEII
jgi:hypothetical protein